MRPINLNRPAGTARAGYDIVLIAGQSNTQYGDDDMSGVGNANLYEYTRAGDILLANDPLDTWGGRITNTRGPVMQFCRDYIAAGRLTAGRKLMIVHCGLGGSGFPGPDNWGGNLATLTIERVSNAILVEPTNSLVAIIWVQGENESNTGGSAVSTYQANLLNLFGNFRSQIPSATTTPIVVGSMSAWTMANYAYASTINAVHASIGSLISRSIYVNNTDLSASNIHFSGANMLTIGSRMYTAWATL